MRTKASNDGSLPRGDLEPEALEGPIAKILLVDDEISIRYIARQILEVHGFTCSEAVDGPSAVETFNRMSPISFCWIFNRRESRETKLPGLARQRFSHRQFKIIIASGQGDRNDLAEALERAPTISSPSHWEFASLPRASCMPCALKEAQDQTAFLSQQLQLTLQSPSCKAAWLPAPAKWREAHDALLVGMAKMAGSRRRRDSGTFAASERVLYGGFLASSKT